MQNIPCVTHWDDEQPSQGVLDGQYIQDGLSVIRVQFMKMDTSIAMILYLSLAITESEFSIITGMMIIDSVGGLWDQVPLKSKSGFASLSHCAPVARAFKVNMFGVPCAESDLAPWQTGISRLGYYWNLKVGAA